MKYFTIHSLVGFAICMFGAHAFVDDIFDYLDDETNSTVTDAPSIDPGTEGNPGIKVTVTQHGIQQIFEVLDAHIS